MHARTEDFFKISALAFGIACAPASLSVASADDSFKEITRVEDGVLEDTTPGIFIGSYDETETTDSFRFKNDFDASLQARPTAPHVTSDIINVGALNSNKLSH
jgi:hypothetical protein